MWIILFVTASFDNGILYSGASQTLEAFPGQSFSSRQECQNVLVDGFMKGLTPEYAVKSNKYNGYIWLERPAYKGTEKLQCTEIVVNQQS